MLRMELFLGEPKVPLGPPLGRAKPKHKGLARQAPT
jgi:hypothetical protein